MPSKTFRGDFSEWGHTELLVFLNVCIVWCVNMRNIIIVVVWIGKLQNGDFNSVSAISWFEALPKCVLLSYFEKHSWHFSTSFSCDFPVGIGNFHTLSLFLKMPIRIHSIFSRNFLPTSCSPFSFHHPPYSSLSSLLPFFLNILLCYLSRSSHFSLQIYLHCFLLTSLSSSPCLYISFLLPFCFPSSPSLSSLSQHLVRGSLSLTHYTIINILISLYLFLFSLNSRNFQFITLRPFLSFSLFRL